jgi:predicted secreted hydrolase
MEKKDKTIYKEDYKPIRFPADEQKHDHTIEWWYFNGNLKAKDGRSFSYMDCLFSAKPEKLGIAFLEKVKNLYFSHYLLSNNDDRFLSKTSPICVVDEASFTKPLLFAHYDNSCLIEETEPFNYHIFNKFVDLKMKSLKDPLLINKNGFIDLGYKTTYYYSVTRMETAGVVKMKDEWIPVRGTSWMDHQWAQGPSSDEDQWIWFSIQLDNGADLLCYVYGDKIKNYHASMIDRQGKTKYTGKVVLTSGGTGYKSKETGKTYQLEYVIDLPELGIKLDISPKKKEQEMVFGVISYWEGGINVRGTMGKEKVKGEGFCELVAHQDYRKNIPGAKSIKNAVKELSESINNNIQHIQ